MATKRPSLGRGLEALLGSVTPTPAAVVDAPGTSSAQTPAPVAVAPRDEELARIPVDLLQRGRYQPRLDMRPDSLQELAEISAVDAGATAKALGMAGVVLNLLGEDLR